MKELLQKKWWNYFNENLYNAYLEAKLMKDNKNNLVKK